MIIGIYGYAGSGKDTVANHIIKKYGFKKDSFAAPLKDAVSAIFGWDRELLEGTTAESRAFRETSDEFWSKKCGRLITPRIVLQEWGTQVARDNWHTNIWVDSFLARNKNNSENIIITDIRFPNEMDTLVEMGALIIKVERPFSSVEVPNHKSEEYIKTFKEHNIILVNDSTIENLLKATDFALTTWWSLNRLYVLDNKKSFNR